MKTTTGIYWDVIWCMDDTNQMLLMRKFTVNGQPNYSCRIVEQNPARFTVC